MASPTETGPATGRLVYCVKLHKELPGLDEVPFDGHPLGQRIYDNVSKDAWKMWVEQMKMIMNEYRLNLGTPEAQEFLLRPNGRVLLWRRRGASSGIRGSWTLVFTLHRGRTPVRLFNLIRYICFCLVSGRHCSTGV